jgi:hypothetical protein
MVKIIANIFDFFLKPLYILFRRYLAAYRIGQNPMLKIIAP